MRLVETFVHPLAVFDVYSMGQAYVVSVENNRSVIIATASYKERPQKAPLELIRTLINNAKRPCSAPSAPFDPPFDPGCEANLA